MADTREPSQNDKFDAQRIQERAVPREDPTLLVRREIRKGTRPGEDRVIFVQPTKRAFRRVNDGILEATDAANAPSTRSERISYALRRFFIGRPIATAASENERLTKFKALAVLSSDAISSVAYATEAILATLVVAGSGNLYHALFITLAIVVLLAIVALSYRQTIPAYPNGGGSYIVAKDNLGTMPGLIAAASLMIDYILTVAVSVSAGVAALVTLFPSLSDRTLIVAIDVALVVLITIVNLRGVRESGSIFAIPTYLFIVSALFMILIGLIRAFVINHQPLFGQYRYIQATEGLSVFLILKSFAAGCSAMTGVEAISNGVPAFKKPETRNAAVTLTWMAVILGTLFIGTSLLATSYHIEAYPGGNPTVIGQIAQNVFQGSPFFFMYPVFQVATLLILTLAANTSYADFPRLASLLARDNFLPHQFAFRGDRLAFTTGIFFLAVMAVLLLVVFKGDTTNLINLYAVGVFLSFTLSQGGMVRHWWRLRSQNPRWLQSMIINGLGAIVTLVVVIVIASTKFLEGAWLVVLLIPILVVLFMGIHSHYMRVERERTTDLPTHSREIEHRLAIPIAEVNESFKQCVAYARSITSEVIVFHIATNEARSSRLQEDWDRWQQTLTEAEKVPLKIVHPRKRSLVASILAYIDEIQSISETDIVTVVLPEIAVASVLGRFIKNPIMFRLKVALFFRPEFVVTNISLGKPESKLPTHSDAIHHRFIVPISELDRASVQSLAYARSISPNVVAAHVSIDSHDVERLRDQWNQLQAHLAEDEKTQLVIIDSPYRSLLRPLLAYIDAVQEIYADQTLTVILPEFVVAHWWEFLLHNQTAFRLKTALLRRFGVIVTDVPQHLRIR